MRWTVVLLLLLHGALAHGQRSGAMISSTSVVDESGNLQMLIYYDPACSCRVYTEYYQTGKVLAKRRFKLSGNKEVLDGEDVSYYPDGTLKHERMWKDALPEGKAVYYHANGRPEHEEFFKGGYKTGNWKYYGKDGKLVAEKTYASNKTRWDSKKDFATVRYYKGAEVSNTDVYENGLKISGAPDKHKIVTQPKLPQDGGKLYQLKCAACHAPKTDGFGPALAGVTKKRSAGWLFQWIKDASQLVSAGDKESIELYNKWRGMKHPAMKALSDAEIRLIIAHIKTFK